MTEVKKSFDENIPNEKVGTGITNYCSWERLKPQLAEVCGLKANEEIIGVTADENGIRIIIK